MFLEGPSLKATDRHFHLIFSIAHFGFAQGYKDLALVAQFDE